ncbi:3-oxosteroid 1-dehydrogenase [Rhodococcus sp. B50]|nr:3-oxosteroid 1-dehydrogenase [Rhodococcus sp. B50]
MSNSPVRPVSVGDIGRWDLEADVVVAGFGIAGVSAAIGAAESGADVVVLERTGGGGGAAALSGGIVYLGGGTRLQKACGFDDTPKNMKSFLAAALGPGVDEDKLDAYCEGSVGHFDWLEACGVPTRRASGRSQDGSARWATP